MEKIKLYIDTNMIHDLFVKQAKAIKQGSVLEKPSKSLFMLANKDKFEFVTSFLTKAEIMRELVSGHGIKPDIVHQMWSDFLDLFKCRYIPKQEFDEQIVDIVSRTTMKKKTLVNFFHIFIAIKEQAYFVSGDKPALEKAEELKLYDKLLTYIELQKLAANFQSGSSYGES